MKSFNEWFDGDMPRKDIFVYGAQSRQAEVDKLQAQIDELQKKLAYQETAYKNVKLQFLNKEDDFNELQAMYEKQGLYAFELQETVNDQLLRIGQLEKKVEQLKCQHFWIGKSENQYCSKCGMSD